MRRTHLLPRSEPCNECEVRKLDVRFQEFFAFVERHRRNDETFPDAARRVIYDKAFGLYRRDYTKVAKLLSMNPNSVHGIMQRRDLEEQTKRERRNPEI